MRLRQQRDKGAAPKGGNARPQDRGPVGTGYLHSCLNILLLAPGVPCLQQEAFHQAASNAELFLFQCVETRFSRKAIVLNYNGPFNWFENINIQLTHEHCGVRGTDPEHSCTCMCNFDSSKT